MFDNLTPDQINNLISAGSGLLGAVIGATATIMAAWLTRRMQRSGQVTLHIKPVASESGDGTPCGFYSSNRMPGYVMRVPVWLDVCNTCGIAAIVRNVNLYAYKGKTFVSEFKQIQAIGDVPNRISLGNDGAYTLVIPENSAKRFTMEFMLHESDLNPNNKEFDELILTYFDEKDKIHAFHFIEVEKCWTNGPLNTPMKWITLKRRCKYAR